MLTRILALRGIPGRRRRLPRRVDLLIHSQVGLQQRRAYRSELTPGGSAYSTQPAATVRSNKILPSKQYLAFKDIKVDAAKNKIKQLNEEIKVSNVSGEERRKLTTARIGIQRRR